MTLIERVMPSLNCSTTVDGIDIDSSSYGSLLFCLTVFTFNYGILDPNRFPVFLISLCANALFLIMLSSIAFVRSLFI